MYTLGLQSEDTFFRSLLERESKVGIKNRMAYPDVVVLDGRESSRTELLRRTTLPKLLQGWSGRRGSNPRRPAWEIARRLQTKTLASTALIFGDLKPLYFRGPASLLLLMEQ